MNEKGVKQYIISASEKQTIVSQMSTYNIESYFDDIISPSDGYAIGKIGLAKQWVAKLGIDSLNTIMIGDTLHDYETARAIGIDCAPINCGHQNLSNIKSNERLKIINRPIDLKNIVFE